MRAVEVAGGLHRGGASCRCEGCPGLGARAPPATLPLAGQLGSAAHMPWASVCWCGDPHCPFGLRTLWWVLRAAGAGDRLPRGGGDLSPL